MTKILLVEDDQALREIYGARLIAEGYDVVSASDGEMALAMTIKEQPDLILSDIMMPKVSGFEMVDILKTNPGTRHIKIVVMTALSNDSQREKGEALGVDRYLVKSQVSIEDVVDAIHELMGDKQSVTAQTPIAQMPNNQSPTEQYQAPAPPPPTPITPQPLVPTEKKVISPLDPNLTLRGQSSQPSAPSSLDQPPVDNILAPPTSPVTDTSLRQVPEPELPTQSDSPASDSTSQPSPEPVVQIEDDILQHKPDNINN